MEQIVSCMKKNCFTIDSTKFSCLALGYNKNLNRDELFKKIFFYVKKNKKLHLELKYTIIKILFLIYSNGIVILENGISVISYMNKLVIEN